MVLVLMEEVDGEVLDPKYAVFTSDGANVGNAIFDLLEYEYPEGLTFEEWLRDNLIKIRSIDIIKKNEVLHLDPEDSGRWEDKDFTVKSLWNEACSNIVGLG